MCPYELVFMCKLQKHFALKQGYKANLYAKYAHERSCVSYFGIRYNLYCQFFRGLGTK